MNIGTLLTKAAQTFSNKLAVTHGSKRLTYRQFNSRTNRLSNALSRLGVKKGDNVAILQHNYPETLESLFACFKSGCGAVPINFRLHPKEWSFIIDHSNAKAVLLSPEFNSSILDFRKEIPKVQHLITLSDAGGILLDYEQLLSCETNEWIDAEVQPDDMAWLFYTSGTTGQPKGAMLSHRNLVSMTMSFFADICPLGPEDAVLHAAPLSHGSGLYALPNIAKGAANIIFESKSFDPEVVFKSIEKYRITNMWAAPTMVKIMVDSPAIKRYEHNSLKSLIYGGGPMYVEDLKEAMRKLGPCLVQLYGQAESPMTISYLPHRDHILKGDVPQMKRLASAGIQRTDVEMRVVDNDDKVLPSNEMGEIVTRSDAVMNGYWRNSAATADTLRNGWLHTGDVGYIDEDGYLYLMDRSKDMIISGGENIYPREIEEVIVQHPAIREVAVIGVPDFKWGEAIKAIVSLVAGRSVSEEELISFCKANIASYKKPKSIDFMPELPKNNYGKILKRELRAKYWTAHERKI